MKKLKLKRIRSLRQQRDAILRCTDYDTSRKMLFDFPFVTGLTVSEGIGGEVHLSDGAILGAYYCDVVHNLTKVTYMYIICNLI